jgi:hypothetical protein
MTVVFCDWHLCVNEASHQITDMYVKPPGGGAERAVGDINLCPLHFEFSQRNGRLSLDWERVLR